MESPFFTNNTINITTQTQFQTKNEHFKKKSIHLSKFENSKFGLQKTNFIFCRFSEVTLVNDNKDTDT